ncbi:MAG: M4 family metallopeptidase, partial [Ignavibacteriales bacterium]
MNMLRLHKKPSLLVQLFVSLLFVQLIFAQSAEQFFSTAQFGWDQTTGSPFEIRFDDNSKLTKEFFFQGYKQHFGLSDSYSFKLNSEIVDQMGRKHFRFNQYYNGVEVVSAQFILHERNGYIHYANGHLVHGIDEEVNPVISESAALVFALNKVGAQEYMWEDPQNEEFIKREQNDVTATFYPTAELKLTTGRETMKGELIKLVYRVDVYAQTPLGRYYVDIDAKTGNTVNVISRINDVDVPGTGLSNYNGVVEMIIDNFAGGYRLRETGRGNGIETYDMNNGTNYSQATDFIDADTNFTDVEAIAGVSAHWAIEGTYDYYLKEHGRNSVNNNGFLLRSYVHYAGGYFNAFWDGSRMSFGDGNGSPLVSIDICGHEMTHGVTQFSAGLIYQDQSGALNESFSDIFGTAVEFYLEGSTANWLIAEDLGAPFRSMEDPNVYSNPDTYEGSYWIPAGGPDNGGVHTNSGVQNFWFYLLTVGGNGVNDNGDPYSVTGIGLTDAAKIAYRNLEVYLTPSSPFFDARLATINSTIDLFGKGSQQYISALDAWNAVGVYQPYLERKTGVSSESLDFLAEVSVSTDDANLLVSNIGLEPLTITDIQISGTNFEITSLPSFPLNLTDYLDNFNLNIVFTPTSPGDVTETISVFSDDPLEPVITVQLNGKGFVVNPAQGRVLYASSNSADDGMILTINKTTGEGTLIGSSYVEEITSLVIDSDTRIMYGINAVSTPVMIFRVNSTGGDSYFLTEIDLSTLAGMSFDNAGTLYAVDIFGKVYTVDLSNSTYNFVVDANTSVSGFTFHPLTNELWATSRAFVGPNKDKIFKINLTTGDVTLIGHTGLNVITNSLVFDENQNLYGTIGGSGEISDLIQINTSTGIGTILGSTGFENITGLAYHLNETSSVNNEEEIPKVFALEQNYPNPFNPTTTIRFNLPSKEIVSLKIYDILGNQVAELLNEEKLAGS